MRARSILLRLAGALAVVAAVVVAPARPAAAHVNLVTTQPADGALLSTAPTTVLLRFSEAIDTASTTLTLSARGATPVALTGLRLTDSGRRLEADLPALDRGVYSLAYKVRDPIDLHATAGTIVFGVGVSEALVPVGARVGAPRPLDLVARALERLALCLVVGAVAVAALVAPRAGAGRVELAKAALAWARRGALALLVAAPVALAVEVVEIGSPWGTTIRTVVAVSAYGRRLLVLAVLAAGVFALAGIVRRVVDEALLDRWRRHRYDELSGGLLVLAVASSGAVAVGGHASTGGSFAAGLALRIVHLVAMGAWAGGLAVLVATLRRARHPAGVWRGFGAIAGVAMTLLVVTGLLLGGRGVATVTALLATWYGRILVVKLVVLAAASVFGIAQARRVRREPAAAPGAAPGPGPGPAAASVPALAGRGLRAEAVLALAVVLGGASLTASPPALGPRFSAPPAPTPPPVAQQLGDVTVKLSMRPNRPGPNLVTATVVSTRRPEPGPITGVRLTLTPAAGGAPISVTAGAPTGGRADFGTVDLPAAGALTADIVLERAAAPVAPARFSWQVDPVPVPRANTIVSTARIAPMADVAAVVAALAGVGTLAAGRRRGRRARPAELVDA